MASSGRQKPPTLPATERAEQSAGVVTLQEPKVEAVGQLSITGRAREQQRAWHRPERKARVGLASFAISPINYAFQ